MSENNTTPTTLTDDELLALKRRIEEYCRDVGITTLRFLVLIERLRRADRGER